MDEIELKDLLKEADKRNEEGRNWKLNEGEEIEELEQEEETGDPNEEGEEIDEEEAGIMGLEEGDALFLSDLISPEDFVKFQDIILSRLLAGAGRYVYNDSILAEDLKLDAEEQRTLSRIGSKFMKNIKIDLTPTTMYIIALGLIYVTKFMATDFNGGKLFKGKKAALKAKKQMNKTEISYQEEEQEQEEAGSFPINQITPDPNAGEILDKKEKGAVFKRLRLKGYGIETKKKKVILNGKTEATETERKLLSLALGWGYKLF